MPTIQIEGMKCQHCVGSVRKALEGISGLSHVQVDLENKMATYDGDVDPQTVQEAIEKKGFQVVGKND